MQIVWIVMQRLDERCGEKLLWPLNVAVPNPIFWKLFAAVIMLTYLSFIQRRFLLLDTHGLRPITAKCTSCEIYSCLMLLKCALRGRSILRCLHENTDIMIHLTLTFIRQNMRVYECLASLEYTYLSKKVLLACCII